MVENGKMENGNTIEKGIVGEIKGEEVGFKV